MKGDYFNIRDRVENNTFSIFLLKVKAVWKILTQNHSIVTIVEGDADGNTDISVQYFGMDKEDYLKLTKMIASRGTEYSSLISEIDDITK